MNQFKHFKGVFQKGRDILTKNLVPGERVYDEDFYHEENVEYRTWNPEKSKLGAALMNDVSQIGIKENDYILYLGASTGTTVSHVSDIVGKDGLVFALDHAPRVLRDLVFVAEKRGNIAPILADANKPDSFKHLICEVDTIFMDIAQKNQPEILLKNVQFLRPGGFALIAVKSRSIDVTRNPRDIFAQVRRELEKELILVDQRTLEPFEKDHQMFVFKKKV